MTKRKAKGISMVGPCGVFECLATKHRGRWGPDDVAKERLLYVSASGALTTQPTNNNVVGNVTRLLDGCGERVARVRVRFALIKTQLPSKRPPRKL